MFGRDRWNPLEEMFNVQREVDRLFNRFWADLPDRTDKTSGPFQVTSDENGWNVEVPMPGIDPKDVVLEAAGNTLSIRAESATKGGSDQPSKTRRFEQSLTLPQFLNLEKLTASHRHGMLELHVPLKESVKPRRIAIETVAEERKQLAETGA